MKQTIKQQEQTEGDLFITDKNELINNSWNLLLRKKTALEEYKEKQKEIIRGIFEDE
jgi:hypothetical protein